MNWDAIGAIGEIVGALAVVLTLVYLATQVRYAKETAADNNRIARAAGVRENMLATTTNPDLRAAKLKVYGLGYIDQIANDLDITAEEAYIIDQDCGYWFWLHWGQFSSTHSKSDLEELKNLIGNFYTSEPVYICWTKSPWHKPLLDPGFVKFVDEILDSVRRT